MEQFDNNVYEVCWQLKNSEIGFELFRSYEEAEEYYQETIEESEKCKFTNEIMFITWKDTCDKIINSTWMVKK